MRNGVGGSKTDLVRHWRPRGLSVQWLLAGLGSPGVLLLVSSLFLLPPQLLWGLGVELMLWGRCLRDACFFP